MLELPEVLDLLSMLDNTPCRRHTIYLELPQYEKGEEYPKEHLPLLELDDSI